MKTFNGNKIFIDNGYPAIYKPEHHLSKQNGTIRVHILVMEEILNRPLRDTECVHHINEDKTDYSPKNLMCFKTNSDHIAFHHGARAVLTEDGSYVCVDLKQKGSGICINCGEKVSKYSLRCRKCNGILTRKLQDKDIKRLQNIILSNGINAASKWFCVTETTIRKWIKLYNLEKPHRNIKNVEILEFIEYLKNNSIRQTAKYFGITVDVTSDFMHTNNIVVQKEQILCKETGIYYKDAHDAAKNINYEKSISSSAYHIRCAAKNGDVYANYHWQIIPRKILY